MKKAIFLLSAMLILSSMMVFADSTAEGNTTLNIDNTAPTIETIFLSDLDGSPAVGGMDLSAGETQTIYCYGTYDDADGLGDVSGVSARIWQTTISGYAEAENMENHYRNATCDINAGDFSCEFEVQFFARPGEWACNATVIDNSLETGDGQDTEEMNELLGIGIPADLVIDFGSVAMGGTSSNQEVGVQNTGNIQIDFALDAYRDGQPTTDTESMACLTGTIPANLMQVSLTGIGDWGTIVGNGAMLQRAANLSPATHASPTPASQETYWRTGVPGAGVGGTCSGKVFFEAISS